MSNPSLEMYRPMLDVRVCSLGFTLDQTIYFMGNDSITTQLRDLEKMHKIQDGGIVIAYLKMEGTRLDIEAEGFQITLQIYDFSPGGYELEGVQG